MPICKFVSETQTVFDGDCAGMCPYAALGVLPSSQHNQKLFQHCVHHVQKLYLQALSRSFQVNYIVLLCYSCIKMARFSSSFRQLFLGTGAELYVTLLYKNLPQISNTTEHLIHTSREKVLPGTCAQNRFFEAV